MKHRLLTLAAILVLLFHGAAVAQERSRQIAQGRRVVRIERDRPLELGNGLFDFFFQQ